MLKQILSTLALAAALTVSAQTTPDLRLHTSIYNTYGPTNAFTLTLGAAPGHTGYADVVCSGGNQSEAEIVAAHYDESSYALLATNIACQVDAEGVVEVYCDEGVILDYICVTGAEVTSIEVKNPEAVEILSLEHNLLESLDLTGYTNLVALYLSDNPFDKSPLVVGPGKPRLTILDLSIIDNLDPAFDIDQYPALQSFDAMATPSLRRLTPAGCPRLQQLSIDNTSVESLDVSHNPELLILNISETRIPQIDLRNCPKLQQFYATHSSARNSDVKLKEVDLSNCPDLIYLFLTGNDLTQVDVTRNTRLRDLYVASNHLTSINLDRNPDLVNVFLQRNNMNFNTLPIPRETWGDYDLRQRPLEVPGSNLVGTPIDLSVQVRRPGSETVATVFSCSELNPGIDEEVDPALYTFADGVITFNTVIADSVYVSFYNGTFPDITLETTKFRIKDAASYGKEDKVISIGTSLTSGKPVKMFVGIDGATPQTPKTFYVNLGNGEMTPFTATSASTPSEANVDTAKPSFGTMAVYVPEGEKLTAFKMEDTKINNIDLQAAHQLRELTLTGASLSNIDLSWCRMLSSLTLTGNNFADRLTLAGANGGYSKNFLSRIVLSGNNMTAVKLNEPGSWRYLDLSDNMLGDVDLTDADYLEYLDVSRNRLHILKVNYCGAMHTLLCTANELDSIFLPEDFNLKHIDFRNNRFTLANMPARHGLSESNYLYAPQAVIEIPAKGPGYNLRDQYVTVDGKTTVFTWKSTDGETLTEGTDYTLDRGVTRFADATIGKTLYCDITHPAYPAFTGADVLRTSSMLSAGMPKHLLGSFVTPEGGDTLRLSIASAISGNALYIDWAATETVDQYPMGTTYTVYNPITTAGATVKVYSYDEEDNLTVFSLSGTRMTDVDFSPMRHLTTFSLGNAGVSSLKLPQSPDLSELMLDGNEFSSFDFSVYPKLSFVSFGDNKFTDLDLSPAPGLQSANFAINQIKSVKLDNPHLWALGLSNNLLTEIDLSGVPAMYQMYLDYNHLSSINLDMLHQLRVIYLDHNDFDFSNLPLPRQQWTLYTYGGQPEIKIESGSVVDLSYLAARDGVETKYTWFYGYPDIDTLTGEISGEELVIGEEYTINGGITTFHSQLDKAVCVMTNELFPNTYLITNSIATVPASVTSIEADGNVSINVNGGKVYVSGLAPSASVTVHSVSAALVASARADSEGYVAITLPAPGFYLLSSQGQCWKVKQ